MKGRCSIARASSFPPPVTTCFLPQHFDPAASSVPGPMAPSVTAQVLCEQRPWWPPCHRAAAFSLSTDFHRFPSHFHCQPEARLHNFPGPFCEPPASCFLCGELWRLTPPSVHQCLRVELHRKQGCLPPWPCPL